jgi:hypothetical protein
MTVISSLCVHDLLPRKHESAPAQIERRLLYFQPREGDGMGHIGFPELLVVLVACVFGLLPWVIGIWALVTLQRVKEGQRVIENKLDALSARLPRP